MTIRIAEHEEDGMHADQLNEADIGLDTVPASFFWLANRPADENYFMAGSALSHRLDNLYRTAFPPAGLIELQHAADGSMTLTRVSPDRLWVLLVDGLRIVILNAKGDAVSSALTAQHRRGLLGSELFLQHFRPLTEVAQAPVYVADGTNGVRLLQRGYHQLTDGQAILCTYEAPSIADSMATIELFLDAMNFDCEASRSNAVGAALTYLLRRLWPGGRPLIYVSADQSHAGKGTLLDFIVGDSPTGGTISYSPTNWALEKSIYDLLVHSQGVGLLQIDNADLEGNRKVIRSAAIERMLTDPAPILASAKSREPLRLYPNNLLVALTTNFGQLSPDLLNRSLPIHLSMIGDVHTRRSAIGNPRHEFLPQNCNRIAAELRGMIARWQAAGSPLDTNVIHPFSVWARVVGGILAVNGYHNFLANYGSRRAADDHVKVRLAILGAQVGDDGWYRAKDLVPHVLAAGIRTLAPEGDRENTDAIARGIGVTLSKHLGSIVEWLDPDTGVIHRFQIDKTEHRQRWKQYDSEHGRPIGTVEAHHRYRFVHIAE